MLPGRHLLYRCTSCNGLFSNRIVRLGDIPDMQCRSDGQMNARKLPQTPPLVACPHCKALFCMLGSKYVIEFFNHSQDWDFRDDLTSEAVASRKVQGALAEQFRDVPGYDLAAVGQCLQYVQSQEMAAHETQLRIYTWHRFNDERIEFPRALNVEESKNLQLLLSELQPEGEDDHLVRAEFLRELGQFDEAAAALDRDFSCDADAKAEQIMQAIERQDDQPFIFASSRDDEDIEFAWAWQARRYTPDLPEMLGEESFDPPVFKVSNRDWWVKVLGMCSHNWALIEPQNPVGAMVYFFHDMGTVLCPTDFKRGQLEGRSAVVDSLSFESVAAAQMALRRNDFKSLVQNPGPWFGFEPTGHFYDARATEEGVYSRKGYWEN